MVTPGAILRFTPTSRTKAGPTKCSRTRPGSAFRWPTSSIRKFARLRLIWENPQALNPKRIGAEVTRAVSVPIGELARELRAAGHDAPKIAGFLTRCLFSMFAEDVGLLPAGAFRELLEAAIADPQNPPESFVVTLGELWQKMDSGGYSLALRQKIPLQRQAFKQPEVIALTRAQIEILHRAACQNWKQVELA